MVIAFNFECSWNSAKIEKISRLIKDRILLLVGVRVFENISLINFCDMEQILKRPKNLYSKNNYNISDLYVTKVSDNKTYELSINKNILFSMMKPGIGQSNFDNLILEFKYVIQNETHKKQLNNIF